jgi:hypothetical protein
LGRSRDEFRFIALVAPEQVGVEFGAPAPWAALEDVGVVEQAIDGAVTAAVSPRSLPQ